MTIVSGVVARALVVPTFIAALALLVKGHGAPGGGFSAGIAAGLALVLQDVAVAGTDDAAAPIGPPPGLAWGGMLALLAAAFVPIAAGEPLLSHSASLVLGRLELGTALLFDVGIMMLVAALVVTIIRLTDPLLGRHGS